MPLSLILLAAICVRFPYHKICFFFQFHSFFLSIEFIEYDQRAFSFWCMHLSKSLAVNCIPKIIQFDNSSRLYCYWFLCYYYYKYYHQIGHILIPELGAIVVYYLVVYWFPFCHTSTLFFSYCICFFFFFSSFSLVVFDVVCILSHSLFAYLLHARLCRLHYVSVPFNSSFSIQFLCLVSVSHNFVSFLLSFAVFISHSSFVFLLLSGADVNTGIYDGY